MTASLARQNFTIPVYCFGWLVLAGCSSSQEPEDAPGAPEVTEELSGGTGGQGMGEGMGGGAAVDTKKRVPVFMAHGDGLQTIMSCDDGKTWVNNRFETTELTGGNWGHDATSVRDLAYGDGAFVAASGWGKSATGLLRSTNGVDWATTFPKEQMSFWSGTHADGLFFFFERKPAISSDGGLTWSEPDGLVDAEGETVNLGKHGRMGFGEHSELGKRWVAFGADDNTRSGEIAYSEDTETWTLATRTPATDACLTNPNGFGAVFGNDVFVIASNSNSLTSGDDPACISSDGGASWDAVAESFHPEDGTTGRVRQMVFHDGKFFAFTNGRDVYTSNDGVAWTFEETSGVPSARGIAVNPETGAWAAVSGSSFYRSDDGLSWSEIKPSAIEGADREKPEAGLFQFGALAFGYAEPTEKCSL